MPSQQVTIYTDGACTGNPGPGGYGIVLQHGRHRKELSGGYRLTTNNRMELMAAIVGLRALKTKCAVTIYSDSKILVEGLTLGTARCAKGNNWRRGKKKKKTKKANSDLWEQILDLERRHEVTLVWVKGHAGQPDNERADQLAVEAARQSELEIDSAYEKGETDIAASEEAPLFD